MTNKTHVQLIEQYLTGSLSTKECIRVELLILTDETFGKLFNDMKTSFEFIAYKGRVTLSKKMKEWELNLPKVFMENHNIQEKIENYLVGRLSVDEILEFEKKLENDPQFRQQFEETKLLLDGIQYTGRKKLFKRMQHIEAGIDNEKPQGVVKMPIYRNKFLAYAAGFALLLALTFLIWTNFNPQSSGNSFADSIKTYPSDIIQRSAVIDSEALGRIKAIFPDHSPESVYKAFLAYEGENYSSAITDFEKLLEEKPSATLSFYKGQSLLANGKPLEAIVDFDNYLASKEQRYINPSIFYKGLAFIEAGEKEKVKKLWVSFANQDCHYCEKANELLGRIK